MALTITKKKQAEKPREKAAVQAEEVDLSAPLDSLVDTYYTIDRHIKTVMVELKPYQDDLDKLKKKFVEHTDKATTPDKTFTYAGDDHQLVVGAKSNSTVITAPIEKVAAMLGTELFHKLAKINIGDLQKYLTPEQFAEISKTERTGYRSIKVI